MADTAIGELRKVHLPPKKLEKCSFCSKTTTLRLCSSCGEQSYCSTPCQKEDWPKHKVSCGKTDRIDIASFYPFLACLAEACHVQQEKPQHPAIYHTILNTPNPGGNPTALPDNSSARLIILGEPINFAQLSSETWWPTAATPKIRSKLFRRILCEGYLLPILTGVCISLLAEMYTTTAVSASDSPDGKLKRRVRLQYHSSPISDFGIAKGRAEVKNQDKLAYFNLNDNTFEKGQDPDDHYWLYFTTITGEEFTLDCGMFTFNFCIVIPTDTYCQKILPSTGYAPAYFRDREHARLAPNLYYVKKRFSFLQNTALHTAVERSDTEFRSIDVNIICDFMESIAERKCTSIEKNLAMKWAMNHCAAMDTTLRDRAWATWPKEPELGIEGDPEEMDESRYNDEAWWKYMKKWNRKYKRGDISLDALGDAFRVWSKRHPSSSTN